MKHYSFITNKEIKMVSNFAPKASESVTDKSQYRPEIATLRDKAISLANNGAGRIGLYDVKDGEKLDHSTMQAMSFARSSKRDITEVEQASRIVERSIEKAKETDKQNIKNKSMENAIKQIAENTKKGENETKTE